MASSKRNQAKRASSTRHGEPLRNVERIIATVTLSPPVPQSWRDYTYEMMLSDPDVPDPPEWVRDWKPPDDDLSLEVTLAAELGSNERIRAGGSFGICGPRRGTGAVWHRYHGRPLPPDPDDARDMIQRTYRVGPADITDSINEMLGRDPELHRPPLLAWGPLIDALRDIGVDIEEIDLLSAPLTIELGPEVEAELAKQ